MAFAAWLGGMLLSGTRNKVDAFISWGWDYFSKDRSSDGDRPDATRIDWGTTTRRTTRCAVVRVT